MKDAAVQVLRFAVIPHVDAHDPEASAPQPVGCRNDMQGLRAPFPAVKQDRDSTVRLPRRRVLNRQAHAVAARNDEVFSSSEQVVCFVKDESAPPDAVG